MGWVDLDQLDDEEKKKKLEEKYTQYQKEIQDNRNSYLQQTGLDKIYNGDYSNSNDGFNTAGRNDYAVKPSIWNQIKTTASNMLGNTGYGIGNGLIGFAQNERRNQTATKALKSLGLASGNFGFLFLNKLEGLEKSLKSTLDYTLKDNNTYNSLTKAYEDNKNNILNKIDEKLQKQEDINNENIQKNIQETTNPIGQKLVEIAPSLGQMIPSAIPGIGTLYSVGSATDSYYDEAKARGMNDEQASNYSQVMGVAEGLTEQIGVGKLVKGGKGIAKGTIKEAFKDFGIGVADNFIQEAVIEPISEGVTKATAGDEYLKNDYRTSEGWKNLGKDMLQSGFDGAITAGIMGGVSAGLGKSINVYNKLRNGQQPTVEEYKSAYTEQRENGIDVDGNVQNEFINRINKSIQETKSKYMQSTDHNNINDQTNTQQGIANRLNEIVKNDKYLSQEDKQAMIDATNNLASKNQLDTDNTLDAINQIKQMSQLSQEQKDQLDAGKKYLSGRKEIYNKYRNVTDYDNSIVQQAKDTVAPNKQGKRTKEQWLDVAKYIGTNIAYKPNSEIQKIAYKSWQEETPNNSATLNKQGQKYVKFMSDDWIDTIYDAVDKQRQKSGYVANNDTVKALDNLYNEYTNNQVLQNNNIQNNIDTSKMNLVDSAKAYNLNGNDETIQSINQKLNDRGISSRFDGNLFKDANGEISKNINALWRTTKDENGNTHREIVFNPYIDGNINEQKTMQQVTIHEMLHDMARDEKVKGDLFNLVLDKNKTRDGYSDARRNLEEMYSQVYDKNSEDFKNLVDEEEVADTLAQKLGDQDFINSLNKEKPNVFKRIYSWIVNKLNKFTGNKNEKLYWEDVKNKFENAYKQDYQRETDLKTRFDIVTQGNKQYVKASRQVISGKNPLQWEEQVENYINEKIRNGEDVQVLAKDGDILSITGDTAGKAKFRNEIIDKNGKKRRLNNKEFMAKLRAETHIDELAQTSTHKNGPVQDTKNHSFAKDGWNYRTAYFEDINGSYYRITMSVGKNGQINTIYNIGKMQNWQKNRRHSISELKGSSGKTTSDRISSTNSIPTSYNNVNTTNNNNSMQESENNSGSFNLAQNNTLNVPTKKLTENQRQNRLEYLKNVDISNMKLLEKSKIKSEIRALENGYNSVEEMRKVEKEQEQKAIQEYYKKSNTIKDSNKSSFKSTTNSSFKEQQLGIIQKTNPMLDDYHTGIRTVDDIKTFKEAYDIAKKEAKDGGWTEYASYPDITNEMIEDSLKTGEITVYSSNDIKNGAFVTPSYEQALDYAGGNENNIKSKKVKVDDVAWINLDEGQYAKVDNTKASEKQEVNKIKQDGSITMTYVRNANTNTQNYGSRYGQNIEPAGEYMSMDTMEGKYKIPGFEYGTIDFKKPLILEQKDTTPNGWKKDLSNKYGGLTGKKLSDAIKKDGYDAIMTKDEDGNFIEVVNLNGKKNNNSNTRASIKESGAWQSFLENQIGPIGKGKTIQELRLPTKENLNTIKQQNIINQNNKERLKDIGITENSDIVTKGNDENIDEEKIANILTEMPTKEKEKSRALAILKANILDKGIVFEELSRKTKNRELQGKWDYTLTASARGQNAIGNPRYEFDSKTKTQKLISKSLESIREEVGKNIVDFNEYMYHQLNIDRMTLEERFGGDTGINYERKNQIKNKPVFGKRVTAKVSQNIVNKYEKNNPEFKKWAKDIYDFLDANTQELVKTGVISEDTRELFKEMYPHYVPISRVDNKGNAIAVPLDTRRTGVNSPIKRAEGGNSDIKPLFETIADRTLQTYRASARNNFGVELLNTLQTVQNAEKIDVDNIVEEITNSEDGTLLKKGTGTVPPSFTVFVNGEKVTFEISKDMYDALRPVSEGLSYRNKTLNKISNFRRGVLTEYNPVFMITNSLKDIQDVVVNSQHTAKTISKLPEAYSQILEKGYWYNEYIQNGGEQNSYFNANDGSFENDKKVSMGKNITTMPLRAISKVNNIIEMSPRLAEYIASREKGRSIETSMLDASRVTTNFKAGGNVTKFLNRNGATFLNASVQGAMQQVRNIQEAKVKGLKGWTALACKYAVAGLPVILLNNILWKDDEDYENLQDYVKDSYYCIAKYGDGKFIRIPKGRTTATIQKIISNISEYITDDKKLNIDNFAKDFWEDLQFTMDNLAPNNPLDNNIISPIIQAVTNTSWYGEDIVPSRLQDKPTAEQYDESTDKFSKWLGEKLKVSPYKINYLLDQYGGGISDIVLPMLTPQAENNMMEDKFTTDAVMKSRYPGEFFEKSDEINVSANSDKATDLDKVKNKYMTNISKEMSKLYEEKRKVENSSANDEIKKNQLKEIQKEINKLAKTGMEKVDKVEINGITAKAGDELYYKYHSEWTKLDEEEKEKTKDISLKSYADFKNKIYNETQRQKDSGELEEDKQLKNTTKSKILLDSNYSDKDKLELYKNYVSSTDKKVSVAVEKLGMPIDVYLNYKSNKFENDKDEDGETISGTKKDKVYNYVNSLSDVDLIYKYMMVKMEDINDSYGDRAILNFVNDNKQLDFEERKEVLETLGFEVDKYGNVENTIFIPIKSKIK